MEKLRRRLHAEWLITVTVMEYEMFFTKEKWEYYTDYTVFSYTLNITIHHIKHKQRK